MPRKKKESPPITVTKQEYVIPGNLVTMIKERLSPGDANLVLTEMDNFVRLESVIPPLVMEGRTKGDWNASLPYFTDDFRPYDALPYDVIREMLKSAPIIFALEMKRSPIVSIFRNSRSWKIHCPDQELSEIVRANLMEILPKMALDFSYSSLVYGVSFQELVWEYKNKYQLGITDSKYQTNKKFVTSKIPNSVNPETVYTIKRTPDGHFNGFVQRIQTNDIIVSRDSSLLIPYNEKFRNLWGESFLKPMYPIWFWYEIILRSMVRYMERIGTPVTVVRAPSRSTVLKPGTRTKIDGISWGMEIATSVARSSAAVLPSDTDENGNPLWDIDYLSSSERSEPFMDILELLTQMILRAGLSADRALSQSSGGVGSYNIGEIHKEATALHNELILIQWIHYLNTYFLPHYSLYNRGVNGPPIWLETEGLDPTDRDNLRMMLTLAQNMDSFKQFGFRMDWETMFGVNNIPLMSEEDAQAKADEFMEAQRQKEEMFQAAKEEAFSQTTNTPKEKIEKKEEKPKNDEK